LCKIANRQTDKKTNNDENITSVTKVTTYELIGTKHIAKSVYSEFIEKQK